jgi:glycosyltransferase involved in cell wall biosynthesis
VSRLRVLFACDWFVRYTVGLASGVADHGAGTALLTRAADREFGDAPGAMRTYVTSRLGPEVPHLRIDRRVRDPGVAPELARARLAVRRLDPDIVHIQESVLNDPRLFLAAGCRRGHYALTVHDLERHPGDAPMNRRQRTLWRGLVRWAGLIFVHGDVLRERLIATERPHGQVVVIPHGTDGPLVAPLPVRPSLLLFGRLTAYKGLDTLLTAMPMVWARAPETRLLIAGEGDIEPHPVLDDGRVLVRNEHVPDADVPELFGAATCVVLPYREASQSGVAAVAKRHGRPIVATNVGALGAAAHDGATRIVPPEDPPALARALVEVVCTPGTAARMGRAAADTVRQELSWTRVGEATLEAYRRWLIPRAR